MRPARKLAATTDIKVKSEFLLWGQAGSSPRSLDSVEKYVYCSCSVAVCTQNISDEDHTATTATTTTAPQAPYYQNGAH